jgi:hypothetical protein
LLPSGQLTKKHQACLSLGLAPHQVVKMASIPTQFNVSFS